MAKSVLNHLPELPCGSEMESAIRKARVGDPWHTIGNELQLCGGFPAGPFQELKSSELFRAEFALNYAFLYVMCSGASIDLQVSQFLVALDLGERARVLLTQDNYPDLEWCRRIDSTLEDALSDTDVGGTP